VEPGSVILTFDILTVTSSAGDGQSSLELAGSFQEQIQDSASALYQGPCVW
jgi:hypothetical protein